MTQRWLKRWSVVVLALLTGCAGGAGGSGTTPIDVRRGDAPANETWEIGDLRTDFEPGGQCTAELVLELFNGTSPMVLEMDREYTIQARIYNPLTGDTPADHEVAFVLTGDGDADLQQDAGVTDGFGVAQVVLATGTQAPVNYDLHIDTACAPGLDVVLDVQPHATGSIQLSFMVGDDVEEAGKIGSFGIHVSQAGLLCAAADPTSPSPEMVVHTVDAGENQLLIEDAVAGPGYTIMVVGYDSSDLPLAAGCTEGLSVFAGKETTADVTLGPLQINPAGTYQITMTSDFSALTADYPDELSQHLSAALELAPQDVPTAVLDGILVWMDDGVLPEHCDDVSVEIDDSVDAWVAQNMPPSWAAGIEDLSTPLGDLLADPVVGASLSIEGGAFGGGCVGTLDIKSVDMTGAGGDALFLEDAFEVGEAWLMAADSELNCEVTPSNQLLFEQFDLNVNPGRLLLFALVNVVLPEAADGATSLVELFTGHFDCEAMLSGVQQSTLTCINRPMSELVEDCDDAVYAALGDYLTAAGAVGADQVLQVSGEAAMADDDKDLATDALDGEFTGSWILSETDKGPVTVPFTGPKL